MSMSSGLTHVAMSVPPGTLTHQYRAQLLEFYGGMLGWHEMEAQRRSDRLTVAVGATSYINLRERPDATARYDYDHFGVLVRSASEFQRVWADLANAGVDVQLEPFPTNDTGEGSFRFRYLLPLAVEVQYFEQLLGRPSRS